MKYEFEIKKIKKKSEYGIIFEVKRKGLRIGTLILQDECYENMGNGNYDMVINEKEIEPVYY